MNKGALLSLTAAATILPVGLAAAYLACASPRAAAPAARAAAPGPALPPSPGTSAVADAANAFLVTLSPPQRAAVQVEPKARNAAQWSNLPVSFVPRNGVFFRDMNPAQAADDLLRKADNGPGGFGGLLGDFGGPPPGGPGGGLEYGADDYAIAFLGKPSKMTPWLLQIGGHHLAFNLLYKGRAGAATPYFLGVEPATWKDGAGKAHAPLAPMRDALYGLVHSLSPEQSARVRLDMRFSDVYVGPGRGGQFPARREGVPASALSAASKRLVRQAIAAWTGDSVQGAEYRRRYEAELAQTKIA